MAVRTTQELAARFIHVDTEKAYGLYDPAPQLKHGLHNATAILELLESHTRPLNKHPNPEIEAQWYKARRALLGYTHFARKAQFWSLVPLGSGNYILYAQQALIFYEKMLSELLQFIRLVEPEMYGQMANAI